MWSSAFVSIYNILRTHTYVCLCMYVPLVQLNVRLDLFVCVCACLCARTHERTSSCFCLVEWSLLPSMVAPIVDSVWRVAAPTAKISSRHETGLLSRRTLKRTGLYVTLRTFSPPSSRCRCCFTLFEQLVVVMSKAHSEDIARGKIDRNNDCRAYWMYVYRIAI